MIYLAGVVFVFAIIRLLVAVSNLVFRQSFGRNTAPLNHLVSVLIPARNEENNISNLLADLLKQPYQRIEIIVFDDESTDNTTAIVSGFSKKDARVKLICSAGLPEGWLGKNHACHVLANKATGDFLLFLDADVRVKNELLSDITRYTEKYKLGLLSVFPKQIMIGVGEKITVPNMNYILLSLLPLILVRKTGFSSFAAANGQCMLFDAVGYRQMMPHQTMKANKVEDIAIARFYKQNHIPVACLAGDENISCRMYGSFVDSVHGFSKNVIGFFGNSAVLAFSFWLITSFGFLAVLVGLSYKALFFYFSMVVLTRIFISIVSRQSVVQNLVLLIPQQLALGLFIYKAILNKKRKEYIWKGRSIS
jgi:glycosyltransferase involved in cell wall biosynthesis